MKLFGINLKIPEIKFADPKEAKFMMIATGVIAITLLLGIIPNVFQLVQVSSKMSHMKATSRMAQEKIKNLPQLRKNRKAYIDQISNLEKQFYDEDQVSELIGSVSEIAKETGITINSSKQYEYKGNDAITKNPFYRPILIKLELEGKYHNFGEFVNRLERNSKMIRIYEINIQRGEETKKDKLEIELSVLTFLKIGQGVS